MAVTLRRAGPRQTIKTIENAQTEVEDLCVEEESPTRRMKTDHCRSTWSWRSKSCSRRCWRAETLPEVEAELAQLVAALSKVEERHRNIKERLRQMEAQLEKNKELLWVQPLKDQDREHGRQASVLANVAQAFESDEAPGRPMPETLAVMIQEQLDKINEEIRLIQEKKENTEQRAEGIESRVGTGSSSNLRRFKSLNSLNLNATSSHAGSCPPSRGRSKPRRRRHSPARKVDKLGIMTLVCVGLLPAASLPENTTFL
ncbi:liprin-alpha-1-like, partial [Bos taurus]|uniref:liprin-alpha-1-like n=1 Tax=Bos taurus TaxID=9913 RepID=UPI0028CBBA85